MINLSFIVCKYHLFMAKVSSLRDERKLITIREKALYGMKRGFLRYEKRLFTNMKSLL